MIQYLLLIRSSSQISLCYGGSTCPVSLRSSIILTYSDQGKKMAHNRCSKRYARHRCGRQCCRRYTCVRRLTELHRLLLGCLDVPSIWWRCKGRLHHDHSYSLEALKCWYMEELHRWGTRRKASLPPPHHGLGRVSSVAYYHSCTVPHLVPY